MFSSLDLKAHVRFFKNINHASFDMFITIILEGQISFVLPMTNSNDYQYHVFTFLSFCSYNPRDYYEKNAEIRQVIDQINNGYFSPEDQNMFKDIYNSIMHQDRYVFV